MIPYLGCDAARGMLEAFVDAELPMADQVVLEAHLRWCDTCRARVEDVRVIGAALRLGVSMPAGPVERAALASMSSEVVTRIGAERDQSLTVRCRGLFTDTRLLWPALGATLALAVCLYAVTAVYGAARAEHPHSMAALMSLLASADADRNRLELDSRMLARRTLDAGPALNAIPEGEAVFLLTAVVTREGRIATYELLQSAGEPVAQDRAAGPSDEVSALLDALKYSRLAPAQTPDGAATVNVVWLLSRTTVKGSITPDEIEKPLTGAPARRGLRPARS